MQFTRETFEQLSKPPLTIVERTEDGPPRRFVTEVVEEWDDAAVAELIDEFVRPHLAPGFREDQVKFRLEQAAEIFRKFSNESTSTMEVLTRIGEHVKRFTPTVVDENPKAKCDDPAEVS